MKACKRCLRDLPLESYYVQQGVADGRQNTCKDCRRETKVRKPEHIAASKAWSKENKERMAELNKEWKENNRDRYNELKRESYSRNRATAIASNARTKARKLNCLASWADNEAIKAFYEHAQLMTELTGVSHDVDHIIPMKSDKVCGLHVENNLRVITGSENAKKGTSFTYIIGL